MTGAVAALASYGATPPATLKYYFDAAALGAFPGVAITTSASFNGTNQYLTSTSGALSGDFTIEGWYYPTNVTGGHSLFTLGTEAANRFVVSLDGTSVTTNLYGSSTTTYTSTVSINTWTHIAVVRSGTTISIYIGGTASATTETQAGTIGNGPINLGADSGGTALFAGRISNFRIVTSALYSGASLSVPTVTLRAVSGTALLLPLTAAPFMDVSSNLLTVTNTGTVTSTASAPSLTAATTDVTGNYALTSARITASFTGSCSGTTLTVSGVTGTITVGMTIIGGTIPTGTYITAGSGSTWTINQSVTQSSTSIVGSRIVWNPTQGGVISNQFSGDGLGATSYIKGGPDWSTQRSYTVFMGYKLNTGTTATYGRLLNSVTGSPDWMMGGYSGKPKVFWTQGGAVNLTGATADTVWHLDWARFNKTTSVGSLFSVTTAQPTSSPTYTATNSGIGGFNQLSLFNKSDGNECAAGDIAFIRVWDGAMTTAQMQTEWAAFHARVGY